MASSSSIVTHSGTHHADEALAVSMLRKLPQYKDLPLVRTRDPALIEKGSIVVDVGAEYDPARHRYDHHQRGFEETFDAQHSIKLSSAGLVWKHFGQQVLAEHLKLPADDARVSLLHLKLYDDFVQAIDAIDNGISQYPSSAGQPLYKNKTDLSSRVGYTNPRWNETSSEADQNARFERASAMAGSEFFDRVNYTFEAWLPAREIVVNALNARKSAPGGDPQGRILVFDEFASWKDHIYQLETDLAIPKEERVLYVIYPDESGKWRVQAVPINPDSFVSRKPLPESWRGIRDEALSQVTGIAGCIFVHQSGFIGGNATKDGALEMARKAVEAVVPPSPLTSPPFPANARPIVLIGPSNVVAPPPNPNSSVHFDEHKNKASSSTGPTDLTPPTEPAIRHRFISLPHPSTGAPTYFVLYKRDEAGARAVSTETAASSHDDGLLQLHVVRPENVERSWFLGSTGAIHTPVPGSEEAKAAQRAEWEAERARIREEVASRSRRGEQEDGAKETQMGEGKGEGAAVTPASSRRRRPQFAGQVVADGALHMLVPVDPIFILLPLLSLIAPTDTADPGRYQPADDIFDDLATAAYRRLAHKHNERVRSSRTQGRTGGAALASSGTKGAGKQKAREEGSGAAGGGGGAGPSSALEEVDLLEEEGVWSDVVKLGSSRAGLAALGRLCDVQDIGNGQRFYRFSRTKAETLLRDKVRAIAQESVFKDAPSTLGRSYARTLAMMGDGEEGETTAGEGEGQGAGASGSASLPPSEGANAAVQPMDVDNVVEQATAPALSREDRVRLQVALGAVSAWLDGEWRARLEKVLGL